MLISWKIKSPFQNNIPLEKRSEKILAYKSLITSNEVGFFKLPERVDLLEECEKVHDQFKLKKTFIHIGIGGSALGPEMLLAALGSSTGVKFIFINNIDPDDLHKKISGIDLKDALIYVVSKSGTTAETVAAMVILMNKLSEFGISQDQYKDYFIFCTDPEKGELRKLQQSWGISTLTIPSEVGGRFSVLTPVGLLPAMFAGINAKELLSGAKAISHKLFDERSSQEFFEIGFWLKSLHQMNIHQTVMMPYSSLLKEFSFWFVQLWAESLGKMERGLTPIPAYGATDQHSQMQLFMEGPHDKSLMLIEIENFQENFSLKNNLNSQAFSNLCPFTLAELMKAEFEGTVKALEENKRQLLHIRLPVLNEHSLGQLILFVECLTVLMGVLLEVDPFNQPGVEAGKKYAHEWLKNRSQNR
jgi:glucose-6-phosphate isomerase